ncbi:hypothetical protein M0638_22220 [Roseomonas sp. NAR14]|uniref:Uncharacterized protein n=1 Tax=Roseomonas acroporae TaxID=2937791 RepID=A0A9X2BZJ4_9PROT|nr:hypothetical protein [Roseomonas acroporae]MCK8787095.1 hypothetical protein [Roseomonas acroporae]
MPDTAIDIANRALARVGADDIVSLDDDSAEGRACQREYEGVVREALTVPGGAPYRWRFASKQALLTRLQDTPPGRWAYAYQDPSDVLAVHAVTQGDVPVTYDRYDDKVFTDALTSAAGDLVMDYTFRPNEAMWPGYFTAGVVRDLAVKLAIGLREDTSLARMVAQTFDWAGARRADSQGQTARRLLGHGRLIPARFGGRFGRWPA